LPRLKSSLQATFHDHYADPFPHQFLRWGTDYPDYFEKNGGGAVIGTAIDHSAYLSVSHFYSACSTTPSASLIAKWNA